MILALLVVLMVIGLIVMLAGGVAEDGGLVVLGLLILLAGLLGCLHIWTRNSDNVQRRAVRRDLTAAHVHVIDSGLWSADYLTPDGYCTAKVDYWHGHYFIEKETEQCTPTPKGRP